MMGDRLRMLRKAKGITQKELADILNIEKSNISLYESGKSDPPDNIKAAIARYFNISLDYMLGVIDERLEYYDEKTFLKLPRNISDGERQFINEYIEFIAFRAEAERDGDGNNFEQ